MPPETKTPPADAGANGDPSQNDDDNVNDDGANEDDSQQTFTKAEVEAKIAGLRNKNQSLIQRQKDLKAIADKWKGKDPAKVQQALEHFDRLEEEKQRAEGKFDELRETLKKTHATEIESLNGKLTKVTGKLYEIIGTASAKEEIRKVAKDWEEVLLPHVEKVLRVVEDEDGEYAPIIIDAKGNERMGPTGDRMTIADLLVELSKKPQFAKMFDAPATNGSGGRGGRSSGATGNVRISKADAQDVQKYRAAKAEAEKRGTQMIIED